MEAAGYAAVVPGTTLTQEQTVEALRPWVDAMLSMRVVWLRPRNFVGEVVHDWIPAAVTEVRRPSAYNLQAGTVCVRPVEGDGSGVTYVYPPDSDCLALADPRR